MAAVGEPLPGGFPVGTEVVIDVKHPKAHRLLSTVGLNKGHVTPPRFVGPYRVHRSLFSWDGHIPAYTVAAAVGGSWNIPAELILEAHVTTVILGTLEEEGA